VSTEEYVTWLERDQDRLRDAVRRALGHLHEGHPAAALGVLTEADRGVSQSAITTPDLGDDSDGDLDGYDGA
jgi:hypothetical protein